MDPVEGPVLAKWVLFVSWHFMLGFLKENQTRQHDRRKATQTFTDANRQAIIANLKEIEQLDRGHSTSKSQEAGTDPTIQVGTDLVDGLNDTAPLPISLGPTACNVTRPPATAQYLEEGQREQPQREEGENQRANNNKRTRGSPDRPLLSNRTNVRRGTRKRLLTTKAKEGSDSPVGLHVPMCHVNNCE